MLSCVESTKMDLFSALVAVGSSPCVCPQNRSAGPEQWSLNVCLETFHVEELKITKSGCSKHFLVTREQRHRSAELMLCRVHTAQEPGSSCPGAQALLWAGQGGHWVLLLSTLTSLCWACSSPNRNSIALGCCSTLAGLGMSACPDCSPGQPLTASPF